MSSALAIFKNISNEKLPAIPGASILLKEQSKTQKDLTDYLGLTNSTFNEWKSGRNSSYKKHIDKIADYFNVSIDYLMGRTNTNEELVALTNNEIDKELINVIIQLTPEESARLKDFAVGMIANRK